MKTVEIPVIALPLLSPCFLFLFVCLLLLFFVCKTIWMCWLFWAPAGDTFITWSLTRAHSLKWQAYEQALRGALAAGWKKKGEISFLSLRASSPGCSGGPVSKLSGALWQRGRNRKESLQIRLWNLNIHIKKVDAKCWLPETTLVMTLLPLARVFQCLLTFALVSTVRWLVEIWQLSQRGATGELEMEFKFQKRSCKLSLFSPRHHSAPESLLTG